MEKPKTPPAVVNYRCEIRQQLTVAEASSC